jgi:hypothetical protein
MSSPLPVAQVRVFPVPWCQRSQGGKSGTPLTSGEAQPGQGWKTCLPESGPDPEVRPGEWGSHEGIDITALGASCDPSQSRHQVT